MRWSPWILLALFAGCLGDSGDGPADDAEPSDAGQVDGDAGEPGANATLPLFLEDPDLVSLSGAGLIQLNVHTNSSLRISGLLPGVPPGPKWVMTWPEGALDNATACTAWPDNLRLKHLANGFDSLVGATLAPGNHTILLYGQKMDNVTIGFNATPEVPLRRHNGSLAPYRVAALDADVTVEADGTPYRARFNKTIPVASRALLITSFTVTTSGSVAPLEVKQKVEHDAFVCDDDHYQIASPAPTGPWGYRSHLHAFQPNPGPLTWSGHVHAQSAIFPQVATEGDLVLLG